MTVPGVEAPSYGTDSSTMSTVEMQYNPGIRRTTTPLGSRRTVRTDGYHRRRTTTTLIDRPRRPTGLGRAAVAVLVLMGLVVAGWMWALSDEDAGTVAAAEAPHIELEWRGE